MPTARQVGVKFQKWVMDWLVERGWMVFNCPIGGRYQKVRDIFGCDLIARKNEDVSNNYAPFTVWIQATADSKVSMKRKVNELQKYPWCINEFVFIFVKRKPSEIDVFIFRRFRAPYYELCGKIIKNKWFAKIDSLTYLEGQAWTVEWGQPKPKVKKNG